MFGLSLGKLLVLVVACVVGWMLLTKLRAVPPSARRAPPEPVPPPQPAARTAESTGQMEDLRKCTFCDTYVPVRNARSCGRSTCPHAP